MFRSSSIVSALIPRKDTMLHFAKRVGPAACLAFSLILLAGAARAEHPDIERAREAARAGSPAECVALLDPLLAGALPDNEQDVALSWRAWALHRLGRHAEALADYRRLDAAGRINAEDLDYMGACHEALGDLSPAFRAYGRATGKEPLELLYREHADAAASRLIGRSDAYLPDLRAAVAAGDQPRALDIMLQAALAPGSRSSDMLVLAQQVAELSDQVLRNATRPLSWAADRGMTDSAMVYADTLLARRSTYGSAHAAWRNAQWSLCVRNDDKTCEIMRKAWDYWTFDPEKALEQVDKAVKRQPKLSRFRLDRAVLYGRLKDARAEAEFATAIEGGERDTGLRARARWLLTEGRKDEARADLQAVYPLLSDSTQDERTLLSEGLRLDAQKRDPVAGEAYARFRVALGEGDWAVAREALDDATGRLPDCGLYRLGAADLTTDPDERAEIVTAALAMEPDNLRLMEEGLGRLATSGAMDTWALVIVDWARRHPGTAASVQFTDLGRACESFDAPLSLFMHCLAISLDADNGGAWFGRGELWYSNDRIDEGIHDYEFAKSLGYPGAQEQLTYLWGVKADRSIEARRANGTLNAPPSGSATATEADGTYRYCMRCYGTGSIFAWDDGYDAYNHRVRVQKKISCPECMGRGTR
jgi:tetratricopeptide (TPR) repeat protein